MFMYVKKKHSSKSNYRETQGIEFNTCVNGHMLRSNNPLSCYLLHPQVTKEFKREH